MIRVAVVCLQAEGAAYLVTGNVKDLPLRWLGTEAGTPRRFLKIVAAKLAV